MKLGLLLSLLLVALRSLGQLGQLAIHDEGDPLDSKTGVVLWLDAKLLQLSLTAPSSLTDSPDSLFTTRIIIPMRVNTRGYTLTRVNLLKELQTVPQARKAFWWGKTIAPIAALISLSGIALAYVGIAGTTATASVRGVGVNAPDLEILYTKRSLPKTLVGLSLFLGGICLLELSDELIVKSVMIYNATAVGPKRHAWVDHINLGLTRSGGAGIEATF